MRPKIFHTNMFRQCLAFSTWPVYNLGVGNEMIIMHTVHRNSNYLVLKFVT